jgi:hypothetical protein
MRSKRDRAGENAFFFFVHHCNSLLKYYDCKLYLHTYYEKDRDCLDVYIIHSQRIKLFPVSYGGVNRQTASRFTYLHP